MSIFSKLDHLHYWARNNRWLWYFSIFNRIVLALGFIPAGLTKIIGERFASGLSVHHPMGQYLEALHHTGYYYTFIGYAQLIAAILLLIPRTVTLGAMLYFPIILNICILSFAVRFDGSFVSAPLMLLANLYLLFWNYDRLKYILPLRGVSTAKFIEKPKKYTNKFPTLFFIGVFGCTGFLILIFIYAHDVMPRNSLSDCKKQFLNKKNKTIGFHFCECIHTNGKPLNDCLTVYEEALKNVD